MNPSATSDRSRSVLAAAASLSKLLAEVERPDLQSRIAAAAARVRRPGTVVTVVGEFKQGKSSLVNGLLGGDVCPVDDDLATSAITLVSHGDTTEALVRHRVEGEQTSTSVQVADIRDWVSERGNPGNVKQVDRVEIKFPSALLKTGLTLVDTPGMGGLGSGHTAATLAFLPFADGLILVSDASAELGRPEIELLARAAELCPTVMFVQTKIDMYAEWERIFEINRGHLTARGLRVPMIAVSGELRANALERGMSPLNELSNFPELIQALGNEVVIPAKENAAERSASDLNGVVQILQSGLESEKRILEDPSRYAEAMDEFKRAEDRLQFLRGPGAKWTTVVGDTMSDLSTSITHEFRSRCRSIQRSMDERVEVLKNSKEWDQMVRDLQTQLALAVTAVFVEMNTGRADLYDEVGELLRDEQLGLVSDSEGMFDELDITQLWRGKRNLDGSDTKLGRGVRSALSLGQTFGGSKMMLGSISGVSQFGVSLGALATGPFLAGGFVLMGGVKILDDRKRQLATRRQTARQQVRQFIDDVQFDVMHEVTIMIRTTQRDLRDEFGDRLKELQETYTDAARRAQRSAKSTQAESAARLLTLEESLAALAAIGAEL